MVAVIIFGLIIFIHEFGHFIFAKLFKIRVNEFAIGFGPAFFKFKKGETQYALRVLPFGGYCAMEGENEASEDERAFCNAKVWKRIIVVAAGAVFNLILGFVIMLFIVAPQPKLTSATIAEFAEGAVSNTGETPLKEGDTILKINNRSIYSPDDISYIVQSDADGVFPMTVRRDGKKVKLDAVKFNQTEYEGRNVVVFDFKVEPQKNGFFTCIKQSFLRTVSMGRLVWMSLGDLITGKYGLNDLSGPVGVTQIVSEAVNSATTAKASYPLENLSFLLNVLCLITVNLGVFNLLPIPALDGSRIWFLIVEGIRRKPIKHEAIVHAVGMGILMLFMVVLVFKDLWVWIFK